MSSSKDPPTSSSPLSASSPQTPERSPREESADHHAGRPGEVLRQEKQAGDHHRQREGLA
ncbi:MAG: hypothetical protein ACK4S6_14130 [Roseateles asaccharophilus]|uniref:hypothetical protein n=1 Tax=Roseateles asaccharophilus TaxID=582607 RepID=UPI00105F1CC3|nr:hypothetical protein [Roseateles asaccharophilus]MDN3543399.1 hypothetical protein [Roseateles asaccharophilus]